MNFYEYEILLSSYGNLQRAAAAELDKIQKDQIPPRPILRMHLKQVIEEGIDKTIIDVIQGHALF